MISIKSRRNAIAFIKENPDHPIIAIGETMSDSVLKLSSIANNCLLLRFNDVSEPIASFHHVLPEHISQAMDFAKDKEDLVVACAMGISRSSALAYIIACSKGQGLEVLDPKIHRPNPLVVKTGSQFLEREEVYKNYCRWMRDNNTQDWM